MPVVRATAAPLYRHVFPSLSSSLALSIADVVSVYVVDASLRSHRSWYQLQSLLSSITRYFSSSSLLLESIPSSALSIAIATAVQMSRCFLFIAIDASHHCPC
eukprot:5397858-Pleurochrysis_carterae.AAC.3